MLVLIGMAAWGVYYELDSFMTKQFVAKVAPTHARGMVWGVVGTFRNLAYLVGPIIGAMIVGLGDSKVIVSAGVILLLAYSLFALIKLPENEQLEEDIHGVSIVTEMKHWWTLARVTWPVLAMSLLIGLVDAVFWTTGTVVNDVLAETHRYGGLFLSAYMLPSLFVGLAVAKWGIYKGKKHWSAIMLLMGGVVLAGITISQRIEWILGVVLISSIFMGLAWPLIDATYTDFTVRMGRGRKHMIGISSSVLSLAYVVGPIVGGMMAEKVGELESFGWLGVMVASIALLLLITMPRKVRLPENEIGNWDKNL
jgi:MFS family permease